MTLDLVVVGGGFWGSAMAAFAQRKGRSALVLDSAEPGGASRSASGYFSPRWYKDRLAAERAAETAEALGLDIHLSNAALVPLDGASVQRGTVKELYTFRREAFFALPRPDLRARMRVNSLRIVDGGVLVEAQEWQGVARAVYVAAGVWTDKLLAASGLPTVGVTSLGGSAATFDHPWEGEPLWVQTNPYQHVAIRAWGEGQTRVCATVEQSPDATPARRAALLAAARRHVDLPGSPSWEYGLRPVLKAGPSVLPSEASQRVVVGTGGGRIGAIDGFRAAQSAYQHFERNAWKD